MRIVDRAKVYLHALGVQASGSAFGLRAVECDQGREQELFSQQPPPLFLCLFAVAKGSG